MHLQQLTSMPFTSYMRQCLVEIQEAKAHELDEILVHFVKVQYLAERVAVLKSPQLKRTDLATDKMSLEGGEQEKDNSERGAALAGCQAYLDRLVRESPSALKDNGTSDARTCGSTSAMEYSLLTNDSHDGYTTQHCCSSLVRTARRGSNTSARRGILVHAWISLFPQLHDH